jgi:alpha 1,3-glucosidase
LNIGAGTVTGEFTGGAVPFNLDVRFYTNGVARLRVLEKNPLNGPRWEPKDILLEENLTPASCRALKQGDAGVPQGVTPDDSKNVVVAYGEAANEKNALVLNLAPFSATLYVNGKPAITANDRNLFHFEHHRTNEGEAATEDAKEEDEHGGKEIVDYGEDGLALYADGTKQEKKKVEHKVDHTDDGEWEESFGTHKVKLQL